MRKLIESTFMTLNGSIGNPQEWSGPYWDDEHTAYSVALMENTEALLLGRVTYEGFAAAWPSRAGDPFADKFNSMPKYVVSSTLEEPKWNNATVLSGQVISQISKLKHESIGDILVYASYQLVRLLLEHDLVDELRLVIFPVVLGAGERLFGEASDKTALRLVSTRPLGEGLAFLTYETVR